MLRRVLVSYDNECPFRCRHCYTFELPQSGKLRTADEIVNSLKDEEFDIVYVSQRTENFINQEAGVLLCEKLYDRYKKDVFIITRCVLEDAYIERLRELNESMKTERRQLFMGVSICANKSYKEIELGKGVPSPKERADFMKRMKELGIKTVLFLRPIFPNEMIPLQEYFEVIDECKDGIDAIVLAGLMVSKKISEELGICYEDIAGNVDMESEYLAGAKDFEMRMVDVQDEITAIEGYSRNKNIPFFRHSLPALSTIHTT